jgi:GNAT superfamily N-acetyltransferase
MPDVHECDRLADMEIRQARLDELEEFVGVFDKLWPNHLGLGELRRDLELMPEKQRMTLWFAIEGEEKIGVARLYRTIGSYDPKKWFTEFGILPEYRGSGRGRQLYNHLSALLTAEDAIEVRGRVRDDDAHSIGFLERRGFIETKRDFESVLNIATLDESVLSQMDNSAFDIKTAQEANCEDVHHQWHHLFETARRDIPRDDVPTSFTFEEFGEIFLKDEEFVWDVSMFAFDGDKLIGFTLLYKFDDRGVLFQALTAVDKDYRGRGLAKAMKARAMRAAKAKGVTEVHCDNDTRNAPMLSINDRLGYQRKPGMIWMKKVFQEV